MRSTSNNNTGNSGQESGIGIEYPLARRILLLGPTHNNQIKKKALRAPIIQSVRHLPTL